MAIDIGNPGANDADLRAALSNLVKFRGCRVSMTADDTAQNVTTETAVSFDVADMDTDGFWSAGTPTRITIPSGIGISEVELVGQVQIASSTGDTFVTVGIRHKNTGGTLLRDFGNRFIEKSLTGVTLQSVTGPISVDDGDYFELTCREESDNSVTILGVGTGRTTLALKVIGMEAV